MEKNDLQNQLADKSANVDKLKDEKIEVERELAVLKANPLAKEAELLRLKLESIETDLAAVKGKIEPLETTMTRIKLYADAVAAIDQNLAPTLPNYINWNLKLADDKIGMLHDSEVAEQWGRARSGSDPGGDIHTYFLIISKILSFLPS